MDIRLMEISDVDAVAIIEKNTFSLPWSKTDFIESIENEKNLYIVVDKDGEIVAYCGYRATIDEAYIANVTVKLEYRRKSIAYLMLSYLIRRGLENGICKFVLEVRESNQSAIHLYQKLGFQIIGKRKELYSKPIEDGFIMVLDSEHILPL